MAHKLRGKSAIVGLGIAPDGERPGRTGIELLAEAVHVALADCGLKLNDIDGLFATTAVHSMPAPSVGEYLGIQPKYSNGSNIGGSSFVAHCLGATLALEAGLCDVALVAYGSNQRTAGGRLVTMSEPMPYEAIYGARYPISAYALAAARHMHEFGTTRAQLAAVAVAARNWAELNPEAFARDPLTIEDVLNSRMISDPLSKLDCCLVTDGGAAIIITRSDQAKDLPRPPVYFLGAAMAHWHRMISAMPDLTQTAAQESGPRAMEMAGVACEDIDVLELYDAFTINTILFLEDLGFCAKGEGGAFVEGGRIAPGGELAVNTNGGGLSCVHPGMYGLYTVIEAARQLRGTCGARQIENAKIGLAHGNGGVLSSQVTSIWGTEETL